MRLVALDRPACRAGSAGRAVGGSGMQMGVARPPPLPADRANRERPPDEHSRLIAPAAACAGPAQRLSRTALNELARPAWRRAGSHERALKIATTGRIGSWRDRPARLARRPRRRAEAARGARSRRPVGRGRAQIGAPLAKVSLAAGGEPIYSSRAPTCSPLAARRSSWARSHASCGRTFVFLSIVFKDGAWTRRRSLADVTSVWAADSVCVRPALSNCCLERAAFG